MDLEHCAIPFRKPCGPTLLTRCCSFLYDVWLAHNQKQHFFVIFKAYFFRKIFFWLTSRFIQYLKSPGDYRILPPLILKLTASALKWGVADFCAMFGSFTIVKNVHVMVFILLLFRQVFARFRPRQKWLFLQKPELLDFTEAKSVWERSWRSTSRWPFFGVFSTVNRTRRGDLWIFEIHLSTYIVEK